MHKGLVAMSNKGNVPPPLSKPLPQPDSALPQGQQTLYKASTVIPDAALRLSENQKKKNGKENPNTSFGAALGGNNKETLG